MVDGWGCWAARRTATLRFAVTAPANTAMELQFSCVLPRGILQRLDIRTGETRFRQWYRLSLRDITQPTIVLRGPVPAGEVVTVRLSAPWLRRAGKRSSGDPRWIGVGLHSFSIRLFRPSRRSARFESVRPSTISTDIVVSVRSSSHTA